MLMRRAAALAGLLALAAAMNGTPGAAAEPKRSRASDAQVGQILADWPAKPKAVAYIMIKKYGLPQEAAPSMLVWHENGPFKKTVVSRTEVEHNFPKPHTDMLKQVVEYRVPPDKVDDLAAFDGSLIYDRTAGELAAKCDNEAMNILALNLADDIVKGRKTAAQARDAYAATAMAVMTGQKAPVTTARLQFDPVENAADPDQSVIAGAPRPLSGEIQPVRGDERLDDAAILAVLITANANEVEAAMFAAEFARDPAVKRFAEQLRIDHGGAVKSAFATARRLNVTPAENATTESLKEESAEGLAELAQLGGPELDRAFVQAMIDEHQKTLALIDDDLIPAARDPGLRQELQAQRRTVARHLEQAEQLIRQLR